MKIVKTTIENGRPVVVDEEFVNDYQKKGYFAVKNALELIKLGWTIYSEFSFFKLA